MASISERMQAYKQALAATGAPAVAPSPPPVVPQPQPAAAASPSARVGKGNDYQQTTPGTFVKPALKGVTPPRPASAAGAVVKSPPAPSRAPSAASTQSTPEWKPPTLTPLKQMPPAAVAPKATPEWRPPVLKSVSSTTIPPLAVSEEEAPRGLVAAMLSLSAQRSAQANSSAPVTSPPPPVVALYQPPKAPTRSSPPAPTREVTSPQRREFTPPTAAASAVIAPPSSSPAAASPVVAPPTLPPRLPASRPHAAGAASAPAPPLPRKPHVPAQANSEPTSTSTPQATYPEPIQQVANAPQLPMKPHVSNGGAPMAPPSLPPKPHAPSPGESPPPLLPKPHARQRTPSPPPQRYEPPPAVLVEEAPPAIVSRGSDSGGAPAAPPLRAPPRPPPSPVGAIAAAAVAAAATTVASSPPPPRPAPPAPRVSAPPPLASPAAPVTQVAASIPTPPPAVVLQPIVPRAPVPPPPRQTPPTPPVQMVPVPTSPPVQAAAPPLSTTPPRNTPPPPPTVMAVPPAPAVAVASPSPAATPFRPASLSGSSSVPPPPLPSPKNGPPPMPSIASSPLSPSAPPHRPSAGGDVPMAPPLTLATTPTTTPTPEPPSPALLASPVTPTKAVPPPPPPPAVRLLPATPVEAAPVAIVSPPATPQARVSIPPPPLPVATPVIVDVPQQVPTPMEVHHEEESEHPPDLPRDDADVPVLTREERFSRPLPPVPQGVRPFAASVGSMPPPLPALPSDPPRRNSMTPSNVPLLREQGQGGEFVPPIPRSSRPRPVSSAGGPVAPGSAVASSSSSSSSMLPSPVSPRGGALASPREEGEEDGDEEGDAVGSLSFQDALRAEPPPAAITRAERFSIMVVRSERTRNLLKLEGQQAAEQKEPDYAMNAYGEDGSVSSKVRPAESTVSHAREMWFSAYVLFQERHAGMWKTSVGWMSAQDALNGGTSFMMRLRGKHAKLLVRNGGIPPSWRGGIWEVLTGALTARLDPLHTDYYAKLLAQLQERPTKSTKDIEKDVARTMHGHAWFQDTDGLGQAQLKRGLTAFSFRHPQIGYAQSMSTIFATLLLHYHSEEQAFWVFDRLLLTVLPGDYYTPSMLGVKTDCAVLKKLVRKRLSKLSQHFHKKQVDLDMISLPWFLCLFVHALPMHTTMRIWDALIYKGSHVLLSIAIALLAKHEDELCTMMNMGDIFTRIQALCKEEYDCESLIVLALGKQHVRAVDAAKMRGVIRAGIEKQYLASVNFVKK